MIISFDNETTVMWAIVMMKDISEVSPQGDEVLKQESRERTRHKKSLPFTKQKTL